MRANATITVATADLPGGSNSKPDEDGNVPETAIYAKFIVEQDFKKMTGGLEFTPSEEYKSAITPSVTKDEVFDDETRFTLGMALQRFEDSFAKEKGMENDYNFTYFLGFWESVDDEEEYEVLDDEDPAAFEAEK